MEQKRKEDLEKLSADTKELSHVKNVAKRLELKLAPMHQEIVELRTRLQRMEAENSVLVQDAAKNDEILELSTLDKEMAEEKYENLLFELNELKEKWEELEVECETLREENAIYEGLKEGVEEVADQNAHLENVRLTKKNEQLSSALLKFRDLMQEQESTYQEKLKALEISATDAQAVSDSYSQVLKQLVDSEAIIADLRAQLDNALGAEDMIESLTEKNLEMQEKIDELQLIIDELETLKALNDELESNHLLTEKQLLADVDELEELHNANQEKLIQSQERNAYLESAVSKFKEVVAMLESDLSELRASNQHMNADSAAMAQHTRSLMELNLKLNSTAVEANSKAMDLQLGKFEAQQALDQLAIVKCYLSEGYSVDEVAIEALLRLDRIAFKSEIVETFLLERIESMASNLFSVVEYTKIFTNLIEIRRYSSVLAYYVKSSSIEDFHKCGMYYTQTEQVEAVLSSIIEIIKADALQEKSFSKDMESILNKLWVLFTDCTKERKGSEPVHAMAINDLSSIYLSSRLIADVYSDFVSALKEISLDSEENPVMAGIKSQLSSLTRLKVLTTRISNELVMFYEDSKILSPQYYEILAKTNDKCKMFVRYFVSVLQRLRSAISDIKPPSNVEIVELFRKQFQNIYDPEQEATNNITLIVTEKLEEIASEIKGFSLTDAALVTIEKSPAPWIQKEQNLADVKVAQAEKEKEIETLRIEVQRLATNVRSRDKSIEELQVRLGLLNSKMEKSKDQVAKISEVRKALADSLAEEKHLRETIGKLRKSLGDQEKLISKYKKGNFKAESTFILGDFQGTLTRVEVAGLHNEINGLKSLINHLSQQSNVELDSAWLERKPTYAKIFQKQDLVYRSKARSLFTDIRKSVLQCDIVSIKRPNREKSPQLRMVNPAKSQLLSHKDTAGKVQLIVSSLV